MVGSCSCNTVCTCNKICTCIPVCQAHRLLDPDQVIREMAEAVVREIGSDELPYLRWAAAGAAGPLRDRIHEVIAEVTAGAPPPAPPDGRYERYEQYLGVDDPVVALMAAQMLTLGALRAGIPLRGAKATKVAMLLRRGRSMRWQSPPQSPRDQAEPVAVQARR
jgi:hypothetical protein